MVYIFKVVSIPLRQAKNEIISELLGVPVPVFQFLLGRLKTIFLIIRLTFYYLFQFLLGRLKTKAYW